MVLTGAQTTVFFKNAGQMGLSNQTHLQLQLEGTTMMGDMAEWDTDQWDDFATDCRRPVMVPGAADPAILVYQLTFLVPVCSLKRLKTASKMVKYYQEKDCALSVANMQWSTVLADIEVQYKAMNNDIKRDPTAIPNLKKNGVVTKWSPSFETAISQHCGTLETSLKYLMQENILVPATTPPLANGMPHSIIGGSIIADMESCISHTHALFQLDNELLSSSLDKAVSDSKFSSTIKPFERAHDGCSTYLAAMGNHAGDDKWNHIIETVEVYIMKKRWDGTGAVTLEHHVDKLKSSYIDMEAGTEHVRPPNPNTLYLCHGALEVKCRLY